jgi:HSP20 family protein
MLAKFQRGYVPAYWDDFFNDSFFRRAGNGHGNSTLPSVNVSEDENSFMIEMAVPGMSRKDIQIKVEDDLLTISSEKEEKNEEKVSKNRRYMRREFNYMRFSRAFELPESVNQEKIKARHEDGVLKVELPKKEESVEKAPKQIEIR